MTYLQTIDPKCQQGRLLRFLELPLYCCCSLCFSLFNDQIDWDILDYSVMGSMIFTAISLFFIPTENSKKRNRAIG